MFSRNELANLKTITTEDTINVRFMKLNGISIIVQAWRSRITNSRNWDRNTVLKQWFELSVVKIQKINRRVFWTWKDIKINFSIHSESDPYLKNNLSVINNSPQEILDAVIEMEERLEGNNNNNDSAKLNDQFWYEHKTETINNMGTKSTNK